MKRTNLNNKFLILPIFIVILVSSANLSYGQSCGFGCLGMSGVYAGYGVQKYDAEQFNQMFLKLSPFNNLFEDNSQFGEMEGFRFGANIVRAKFDFLFITGKAFYQFMKEDIKLEGEGSSGKYSEDFKLTQNYWGLSIDLGVPVFRFLDLKIAEGGVTMRSVKLTDLRIAPDGTEEEFTYVNKKYDIDYFVGAGLIFHLIENYVSVEGTATYSFNSLTKLYDKNGIEILSPQDSKGFIAKGSLSAIVQLNIGFPL